MLRKKKQDLLNKTVWITGGGSGIGQALALECAARGASVAICGRRQERLDAVVQQLNDRGSKALGLVCDVTDDAQVQKTVETICQWEQKRLDVVIANAGYVVAGKFEDISAAQWRNQFDVNVHGVLSTLRHALPHIQQTHGRLAVVSSVMGQFPMSKLSAYAASKHALMGLCRSLQIEMHGSGVSLTNLMPGLVASELNQVDNNGVFHPDWHDLRNQYFIWPADKAARVMCNAIVKRIPEYIFTGHGKVAASLGRHCPGLLRWLMTHVKKIERPSGNPS